MLTILFIVAVIAQHAYCNESQKIVGGQVAKPNQFPHQVSIQVYYQHIGGGSIISERHIVTAAHVVDDDEYVKNMTVVTGAVKLTNDGQTHQIKDIKLHPDYTGLEDGWTDDIAVITLKTPINFNNLQSSISLTNKNYITGEYRGIISGWGKTSVNSPVSPVLKWAEVNVLSQKDCLDAYKPHDGAFTTKNHICTLEARGIGACMGDSGGPLVINNELVGIASWGKPCAVGKSDVFTNVYHYHDFIKQAQSFC